MFYSWLEIFKQHIIALAPQILAGLFIFFLFWCLSNFVTKIILHVGGRLKQHREIMRILGRCVGIAILTFGAITALGTAGINVSALVAGLGLTGFALGFAFKDIISNVLAGLLILIYRPFKKADEISVTGLQGTVIDIDLRYTTLEADHQRVLIPNSTLFTNPIVIVLKRLT